MATDELSLTGRAEGMKLSATRLFWPACVLILVIGLALRLPDLTRSLWLDETYSIWFASLPLHRLWTEVPLYETHPPFYYTLLKGWSAVFGTTEVALRSFSILASLATILVVAISGRVLRAGTFGDNVSLLAAFFLAINGGNINFAQQARPYALQTLTATIAILAALYLIRSIAAAERSPATSRSGLLAGTAALAIGMGLTLWLHNTAFIIAFGMWVGLALALCLARGNRLHALLVFFLSGIGALLIWSPFLPMFIRQTSGFKGSMFWVALDPFQDLLGAWVLIAGGSQPLPFLMIFGLIGLAILWRTQRNVAIFLACIVFLPWATILAISYTVKPIFINRLFEWMAPTVLMLVALGLLAGLRNPLVRIVAVVAVSVFFLNATRSYYLDPKEDWRGVIQTIRNDLQPGDLVVGGTSNMNLPFSYYDPDYLASPDLFLVPGPYPILSPAGIASFGVPKAAPEDIVRLKDALKTHSRVWLIEMRLDLYDPDGLVIDMISAGRKPIRSKTQDGIRLTLYQ